MNELKRVIVLGASGSIGKNAIDIIKNFPNLFELAGFSVHSNIEYAKHLKKKFPHATVLVTGKQKYDYGEKTIEQFIKETDADILLNAISGASGLIASMHCISTGKMDLALANKESIVMAGDLLKEDAQKNNVNIIPVDSEHSAIFSLIHAHKKNNLSKIILTASGGPFRKLSKSELTSITVEDALKHPTWNMGGKITIDSATLANKALEVIEAVRLFDINADDVIVTVHPQSIIHSLIQLTNGETYAQLSPPDMRLPIFSALSFPNLAEPYLKPLDFTKAFSLQFEPPRIKDFPLLQMGFNCAYKGSAYPIVFNAANETAVEAFTKKKLSFIQIAETVEKTLSKNWHNKINNYDDVFECDRQARKVATEIINKTV
ncbi:MAG: 1-deoxy-D-xylulose-5-phosphate reductoisomerase [Treponema sp.]|nr:MAG: 1-deoxy-D-xylulose-5-phosphate reductoisomerase [Treponema sp.]